MHVYQVSTPPTISCFGVSLSEYCQRVDAAEELEEQMQAHYANKSAYGREILWHPAFSTEYVGIVSRMPLMETASWHEALDSWCHDKRPLDLIDYGFLADCLREGLADNPTPLAALRLARALAWVEQAAEALLPSAQPCLTAAVPEAAPALAA